MLLLAGLDGRLVFDTTVVVQGLDLASGLGTQRLEQSVHIVTALGHLAVLMLPDVLHDEFDYECIEDGTRERCSNPLSVERGALTDPASLMAASDTGTRQPGRRPSIPRIRRPAESSFDP